MATNKTRASVAEKKEAVGPTGWKAVQNEVRSMNYEVGKSQIPSKPVVPASPITAPRPSMTAEKVRPQSEGDTPPQPSPLKRGGGEENGTNSGAGDAASFLEQKLEQPMSIPREEKRYTTDPYREPLA